MAREKLIIKLGLMPISRNFYKSPACDYFFFGERGVTISSAFDKCITLKLDELELDETEKLIELKDKTHYVVLKKEF